MTHFVENHLANYKIVKLHELAALVSEVIESTYVTYL